MFDLAKGKDATRRDSLERGLQWRVQVVSRCERGQEANGDARPNRELREANRHMHEFLDLLGHELRSPLAAIRNALHVLEQQGDDAATRE